MPPLSAALLRGHRAGTPGIPPFQDGLLSCMTADEAGRLTEYLRVLDWDRETAMPGNDKLREPGRTELA